MYFLDSWERVGDWGWVLDLLGRCMTSQFWMWLRLTVVIGSFTLGGLGHAVRTGFNALVLTLSGEPRHGGERCRGGDPARLGDLLGDRDVVRPGLDKPERFLALRSFFYQRASFFLFFRIQSICSRVFHRSRASEFRTTVWYSR